ncbi:MAG: 16S rRNA (guanine(966)-N(2))-methyltransferase RsmD [Ignavibacteriae bacterium]|jgi:16S rRNA (guanine(966)-N(2))-methyltransferase RsmD|nr:16S rRNA (guanine(966)-N(2))-methyltransferase RsmD [Ignavibacteriota bacterium]
MRIISGVYKSRVIKVPSKTDSIRPTTDRARETLFNLITNRKDLDGITCLDLFCGSGSVGLECISRGAEKCVFVDRDTAVIKSNISLLHAESQSEIIRDEAIKFLKRSPEESFGLIFADPPYKYDKYSELIKAVSEYRCMFILEHSVRIEIPEELKPQVILENKTGITNFTFFDFGAGNR